MMPRHQATAYSNGYPRKSDPYSKSDTYSISPHRFQPRTSPPALRRRRQLLVRLTLVLVFALVVGLFIWPGAAVLPVLSFGLISSGEDFQLETVRYYDLSNVQGTARGWEREERILLYLAFLVSDSKDNTLSLLSELLEKLQADEDPKQPYGEVSIIEKDFGQKVNQDVESRHGFAAQASRRKLMAQARNWLLSAALRPYHSWVYWRDVDVETAPFTILEDLMRHNKDVIVPNVWRPLPDWLGGEQPYDLNSWQESETALALADTLDEDAVIVEGYAEYATWRPHLAYLRDPYGDPDMEMDIDGVGGVSILAKAKVFRSGVHFPAFSFEKHAETEGFGKMAKRMKFSVVGLPHYTIWHLYEPSVDDIRHMEEMEQERIARENEEKEKAERNKKMKEQFDDPTPQWEKDKNVIADEALKEKKEKEKAEVKAKEDDGAAKAPDSKAEETSATSPKRRSTSSTALRQSIDSAAPQRLNGSMASNTSMISVAVDPVTLIIQECRAVTSAMRKHPRWAHSSASSILGGHSSPLSAGAQNSRPSTPRDEPGTRRATKGSAAPEGNDDAGLAIRWGLRGKKGKSMQDNPLMAGFQRLRQELTGCKDIHTFDAPSLLHPFLQVMVIENPATPSPITTLALAAIIKFFSYNLISPRSPRLSQAMQSLSAAMTNCRFEARDTVAEEKVYQKILKLMEGMLSGPGGDLLSDGSVCKMMETNLNMCCQPQLSELFRGTAEMTMAKMCQIIFERLKHLEIEAGDDLEALDEKTKEDMDTVKMAPSAASTSAITKLTASPVGSRPPSSSFDTSRPSSAMEKVPLLESSSEGEIVAPASEASDDTPSKPYSLPSICELFRALIDLLDPHDRKHADPLRVIALRMINVALEIAGPSIAKHPALATLAEDRLCRYLFQLVRSDNMAILQESLIVAGTLLSTCREVLKLQQELFLSYLVACLHPRVEIPRERGIDPSLYAGIPQAPKLVKPPPSQASSGRSTPVPVKDRRTLGLEGGSRKPDAREAMVESVGALARIPSYMAELYVNYDCEIDRSDICEDMVGLLSRNAIPDSATWSTTSVPPLCLDALLGFVQFIADRLGDEPKYDGYPDHATLREQKRRKKIIIQGTVKFNESPKAGIAFLASQGIIDDPRDAKTQLGEFISKKGNEPILEALMDSFDFENKRVDEALRELLETFRLPGESALIERIISTFAENYCSGTLPEGIADKDSVYVLTYAIIMLNTDQHNPNMKGKRMELENFARNLRGDIYESIKSNEIILPDEHDNKHAFDYAWKELLLKTTSAGDLTICNTNIFDADMFAATWKPVVATLSYVFMSATDDAVFERVIAGFDQCVRIAAKHGLTEVIDQVVYCLSHITTLATEIPSSTTLNTEIQVGENSVMVSELAVKFGRDVKAQLATVVLFRVVLGSESVIGESWKHISKIWLNLFVNSLIPPFFATSNSMDIAPIPLQTPSQVIDRGAKPSDTGLFSAFASYITSYAADDPPEPSDEELESTLCTVDCVNACFMGDVFANVVRHKCEIGSGTPSSPTNGVNGAPSGPVYDPSMVYILELCTVLAMRDNETINAFGAEVAEALQNVLRNSTSWHPLMEQSYIRVPVVLHAISSFKKDLFEKSATLVLQGLTQSSAVFEILEGVAIGSPPTIMADNYESAVKLLNDFATAGSVGSTVEQKHDKRSRRGQPVKQPKPQVVDAVVARGVKAITMIYSLTSRIPVLMEQSHLESKEAWANYWSPIFMALTTQCTNPCREIRHQAFSSLQRSLLSPELTSGDHEEWTAIFSEVLFPLITRLLKPEVYSSDPIGMSETRVQAATLLCRIFLHYLVLLSKWEGMLDLWIKILDIMDRLMNSGQGDSLEEAVPESLKNVLLVMSSSGYLVPRSQDETQEKLWTETWKRIDRFLPDLRKEIDLEGPGVEENIKGKENEGLAQNVKSDTEAGVEQEKTDVKV
ncbi:Sec7 domain-containing protein [Botrytis cinerea]